MTPLKHKTRAEGAVTITRIACLALLVPIVVSGGVGPAYPLKLSAGNHYLVDQAGTPFFIQGEAAWSLIAQLDTADVETYLSDRLGEGFQHDHREPD